MSSKDDNREIMKRIDDLYYEVRIGTAMLILIIVANMILILLASLGFLFTA